MEATKSITAKEREFIAAVEAHRNAEGKVIAWDICANGNGKVIFENATKDRYSCAHVIDMEGGYFLLFVGERAGHPYDRKTYKRKGNALKGFKMQEGHNEPPTFAATPTEMPQISTQTAETVNVSAESENTAERAENRPERKIKYFHYRPEQLKRYIIDVYDKRANGEWVLHHQEDSDHGYFDVIDDKVIYWHNKSANSFSYANMDFNSPTCGRCFQINGTYQKDRYKVSDEILMEFMCGHTCRTIQKHITYDNGKYEHCYTIKDEYGDFNVNDFSYTFDGIMQRFNDCYKDSATIIWQPPGFAPQSPETPQTAELPPSRQNREKRHENGQIS